jgi:chemotaxis methyl-accepting protein methylase
VDGRAVATSGLTRGETIRATGCSAGRGPYSVGMATAPEPDPNPTIFLGKDQSSEAIREAAMQIWRAIYRNQYGHDPTPEFEAEVLRLHHERDTHG